MPTDHQASAPAVVPAGDGLPSESAYVYDVDLHRRVARQVRKDHPGRLWYFRLYFGFFALAAIGSGLAAVLLQRAHDSDAEFFWKIFGFFVFLNLLLHALRLYRQARAVPRRRPGPLEHATQTIVLSEKGVASAVGEFGSSQFAWMAFCRATSNDYLLLLYLSRVDYLVFLRGGRSAAAWAQLCTTVQGKMGQHRC